MALSSNFKSRFISFDSYESTSFCWILLVVITGVLCSCDNGEVPEKPNLLFITTDYMRGVDVPAVGAPFLEMPTLDKLSREGAVFTRHSSTSPICMPARASIATGHYPHSHSLWDNAGISVRQDDKPFLITDLNKQGYQTIGIGKMHFHPRDADFDYDIRFMLEGKDVKYRDDDYEKYLADRGSSRKEIYNLAGSSKWNIPKGQSFYDWPLDEDLHPDAFVGNKTLETIEQGRLDSENPWFMWVSFTGPHNSWNPPKRFSEKYQNMEDLPLGDFEEGELNSKPIDYTRHRYGYGGSLMMIYDSVSSSQKREIRRGVRAGHYGLLSFVDEQMGKIMDKLEERGQLDNTIVVFSSDHGAALFDNQMLHKGSPFPTQSLVPLVVWDPGFVEPGKRDAFTSHVDLYETFMELAGASNPTPTEGKSLVEMFRSPEAKVKDFEVIESAMVTSIMTDQWLMGVHHISNEVELYNLQQDPMCHNNIAGDQGPQSILDSLENKLVDWRKSKADDREIGGNPFEWHSELGDTTEIAKYRERYIREYERLATFPDSYPGVTGSAAQEIVERIKNEN